MGKPKTKRRVEVPTVRRQAILDQLNKHGPQSARQLCDALGYERGTASTYLREMRAGKEVHIAREERGSRTTTPIYAALVTQTSRDVAPKADGELETRSNVTTVIAPGHTRHLGTHRNRPLQDSGGQGRGSGGSGVISSLGGGPLFLKL